MGCLLLGVLKCVDPPFGFRFQKTGVDDEVCDLVGDGAAGAIVVVCPVSGHREQVNVWCVIFVGG